MKRLKYILSYLLLLVYTASYGHQAIPHHHHETNATHHHHESEGHDHCLTNDKMHDHVQHDDHFDEGFFDYLACVFGDHNQQHEHSELTFSEKINRHKSSESKIDLSAPILVVDSNDDNFSPVLTEIASNHSTSLHLLLLTNTLVKRGPPLTL